MLKHQAISALLAQSVEQDIQPDATLEEIEEYLHHDATVVISSILTASSGQTLAAHHNTRIPPRPRNNLRDHTNPSSSPDSSFVPYTIDRPMKSNIYGLFAASVWQEYAQSDPNWIMVQTADAMFVIHLVRLKSMESSEGGYMLLSLVADRNTPLGLVCSRAKLTADALETGLADYKY